MFVKKGFPQASDDELLKRVMLGHAMLLTLRGVPTIYYGDEQGFVGDGGDQDAREDMFAQQGRGLQRQQAARHDQDHRDRRASAPTTRSSRRSPSSRASAPATAR